MEVFPGHVEHTPSAAGESVTSGQVALPRHPAGVVSIAVGLDRQLEIRIGEVDTRKESSAIRRLIPWLRDLFGWPGAK